MMQKNKLIKDKETINSLDKNISDEKNKLEKVFLYDFQNKLEKIIDDEVKQFTDNGIEVDERIIKTLKDKWLIYTKY